MAPLPCADEAVIPPQKLRDYALNPDHADGGHKARVFRSALGIQRKDWSYLRDQIVAGVLSASVTRVRHSEFGLHYSVPIEVRGLNREIHVVTTGWLISDEGGPPRLTSAYIDE